VKEEILKRLDQIEREENVRIFYACESGSRAWGFESTDSDWDVLFIYVHPRDWYLSIDVEDKRNVIERSINDELDISGWDLRKGLKLLRIGARVRPSILRFAVIRRIEGLMTVATKYFVRHEPSTIS